MDPIGNLNLDGSVDAADAGIMFANWGLYGLTDLDGSRITDAADAGRMFQYWTGDPTNYQVPESMPVLPWLAMTLLLVHCRQS